ncbi:hypothetical protein [Cellulomonas sp. URHD0024]|uniref:hypothetical protein n=1 Tax=Cellulomonas sp. URHD0024 TaxID=1302620 RepID=UPI00041F7D2B|nr:hypothetical protein [Cellulomonas sp. URHD0024]
MASPGFLKPFVDDLAAAVRDGEDDAFFAAGQRLADESRQATQHELDAAVALLAPVLAAAPPWLGGALAQYIGSLIGMAGDPTPVLDALVEQACRALEGTWLFASPYEELVGPVPERAACGADELELFLSAAGARVDDPRAVALSWMYAESSVQPILFLSQRADVRRALPQRERLLAAAIAAQDAMPAVAPWLVGLLRVLDGERLVVLHRPSGAGFQVTIGGIADNFQLHTLLAGHVIPLLSAGRRDRGDVVLPDPPTPAMTAAADGSGAHSPPGGITGQFNLVDATGAWIWNEGRPDEIPLTDGVRIIVLDPPPYVRGWSAGRAYPLLRATVDVVPLAAEDASSWLSRVRPAADQAAASEQAVVWTDDMTVSLPVGRNVPELVALTSALIDQGVSGTELQSAVAREFSLSIEDATLAVDRVLGGVARAATRDPANRPDPERDPIAFESYRRALDRTEP